MRHATSFWLSFSGFLICAVLPWFNLADLSLIWTFGIGLHVVASIYYARDPQVKGINKWLFFLLPVPVGFFSVFFYILYLGSMSVI
ncbi:MAG: hypothetical protein AAFU33_23265 [Bacteroidota bacterium]